MKWLNIALIVIGCFLFSVGMSMRAKKNAFTTMETTVKEGNVFKTTATGAAVGGATGCAVGAAVGGIGIAACGTGVGIPVGVVCLGAAAICALIGGGVGAAFGTPDQVEQRPVVELVSAYSPYEYWSVMIVGAIIVAIGIFLLLKSKKKYGNQDTMNCDTAESR